MKSEVCNTNYLLVDSRLSSSTSRLERSRTNPKFKVSLAAYEEEGDVLKTGGAGRCCKILHVLPCTYRAAFDLTTPFLSQRKNG